MKILKDRDVRIGLIIAVLFLIIGFWTLPDYGLTWDEPIRYTSGILYWNYFTGGDLQIEGLSNLRWYGPLTSIVSIFSYKIFTGMLGLVSIITALRIPIIIFSAIAIFLTYLMTAKYYNRFAGIVAALALFLYPRFFAHSHFNIADVPMAAMFVIVFFLSLMYLKKPSWKRGALLGISLGLSFDVKINSIFIPVILVFWLLVGYRDKFGLSLQKISPRIPKINLGGFASILIFGAISLIAGYPWLWKSSFSRIIEIITFFTKMEGIGKFSVFYYGNVFESGVNVPWTYPFGYLWATTPIVISILAIIGILVVLYDTIKLKNRFSSLVLIWFLIGTLRISFTGQVYDGIRQFFDIVPALCILAGIGAYFLYRLLPGFFKEQQAKKYARWFLIIIIAFSFISSSYAIVKLHPYQSAYYSSSIGGVQGAIGKMRIIYWGEPVKEMIEWVNKNTPDDAKINVVDAPHLALYYLEGNRQIVTGDGGDYLVALRSLDTPPLYSVLLLDSIPIGNVYRLPGTGNYSEFKGIGGFYRQEILGGQIQDSLDYSFD
ncbi:MAG: glycosyltransferase family 39 protein [Nanoarchaeota archaeon]|nr:glycosyltransferase family 39 protein [Nanoarchaeota archaeon]